MDRHAPTTTRGEGDTASHASPFTSWPAGSPAPTTSSSVPHTRHQAPTASAATGRPTSTSPRRMPHGRTAATQATARPSASSTRADSTSSHAPRHASTQRPPMRGHRPPVRVRQAGTRQEHIPAPDVPPYAHPACPDLCPNGLNWRYIINKANQINGYGDIDMATAAEIWGYNYNKSALGGNMYNAINYELPGRISDVKKPSLPCRQPSRPSSGRSTSSPRRSAAPDGHRRQDRQGRQRQIDKLVITMTAQERTPPMSADMQQPTSEQMLAAENNTITTDTNTPGVADHKAAAQIDASKGYTPVFSETIRTVIYASASRRTRGWRRRPRGPRRHRRIHHLRGRRAHRRFRRRLQPSTHGRQII